MLGLSWVMLSPWAMLDPKLSWNRTDGNQTVNPLLLEQDKQYSLSSSYLTIVLRQEQFMLHSSLQSMPDQQNS